MAWIRAAVAAALALSLAAPGTAQDRAQPQDVLTLEEAVALAGADQPRVAAYEREADASEEAAVEARALPDLQITGGIRNFPIRGDDAFDPIGERMTMYTIGVMREQVRRSQREARANRVLGEALVKRHQATAEERKIALDVMIAWIDAVEARAKQELLERLIADLRAGREVMEAGVSTGSATPALVLRLEAEMGLEEAELANARREEARARADLARWIGAAADQPLPDSLPVIEFPDDLPGAPPRLASHPEVQVAEAQQELARRQIVAAREERKPNVSWSVMLGIRPDYGEMISGTVSIPLQLNRRNRQDRLVAEAEARADASALRLRDARRQLLSEHRTALADYEGAEAEAARIEERTLPALESAFEAAEARYAAGGGTLAAPFEIVRDYIEAAVEAIEVRARRARAAARILYLTGETGQ